MGQTEKESCLRVTFLLFVSSVFFFLLQRMNLAVVLALLLSVALVLAKKPFKESKGNKAAAMHKEADEAIVQAATEKIVEAEMADEAEADEEGEADSEKVKSAERNQANAYHRMMRPSCCSSCETMRRCASRARTNGDKKKCWRTNYKCTPCPSDKQCNGRL